jgi:hypothetical protein
MISNRGNITGKLRMAIREVLLAALEAIPEFIVRTAANPIDPNTKSMLKRRIFSTGLPRTKLYINSPNVPIIKSRNVLYRTFESIIAVGFARV